MENNRERFHTFFTALASAGKFTFKELRSMLSTNPRKDYCWEDGVLLQSIVSNITLGRQMVPGKVDAIIAERRRERLNDFTFSIGKMEIGAGTRDVRIEVRGSNGPVGSFVAVLDTPWPKEDWRMKRLLTESIEIYSIEDTSFVPENQTAEDLQTRFRSYTIFDNVRETVHLRDVGHKLLQDLIYQIEEYSGNDERDLYHKFYSYADALLTMHDGYRCSIDYWQDEECRIMLEIEIREPKPGEQYGGNLITSFKHLLKKDGL